MAGNSFGRIFRLTSFGASHGIAVGGVIDGVPANVELDLALIQKELDRRKPGQSSIVTQRKEDDEVIILSGVFEGKTTGMPIGFYIENSNQKSKDYSHLKNTFRPSHADYTYAQKYKHRDYRGGGRSSARETASRVVAGAIAKQILNKYGISINAYVDQVGDIKLSKEAKVDFQNIEKTPVRCPDLQVAAEMEALIKKVRKDGDTIGGCIKCHIQNVPPGLGEPVFDKLHAQLGKAMLSINAVKGFEYGSGFAGVQMRGSDHNDLFNPNGSTKTNNSGGVQGGISNGAEIYCRIGFKPVATIMKDQDGYDKKGNETIVKGKGRHDPCVVPRAVVIVEAMAAITILDFMLLNNAFKIE
jgi:chorismate synthase